MKQFKNDDTIMLWVDHHSEIVSMEVITGFKKQRMVCYKK